VEYEKIADYDVSVMKEAATGGSYILLLGIARQTCHGMALRAKSDGLTRCGPMSWIA
jgi:hypothetical protein